MIKDPNCQNKNWRMGELDEIVLNEIRKLAIDPDYIRSLKDFDNVNLDTPNKITIIKSEIKKINDQISRFMDLYGIGQFTIEQVSSKVTPLNEQRKALETELEKLDIETETMSEEEILDIVDNFEQVLETGDLEETRNVIESLISQVEIDNDNVFIHWKFV